MGHGNNAVNKTRDGIIGGHTGLSCSRPALRFRILIERTVPTSVEQLRAPVSYCSKVVGNRSASPYQHNRFLSVRQCQHHV